jgi:hypothetical protein
MLTEARRYPLRFRVSYGAAGFFSKSGRYAS